MNGSKEAAKDVKVESGKKSWRDKERKGRRPRAHRCMSAASRSQCITLQGRGIFTKQRELRSSFLRLIRFLFRDCIIRGITCQRIGKECTIVSQRNDMIILNRCTSRPGSDKFFYVMDYSRWQLYISIDFQSCTWCIIISRRMEYTSIFYNLDEKHLRSFAF